MAQGDALSWEVEPVAGLSQRTSDARAFVAGRVVAPSGAPFGLREGPQRCARTGWPNAQDDVPRWEAEPIAGLP